MRRSNGPERAEGRRGLRSRIARLPYVGLAIARAIPVLGSRFGHEILRRLRLKLLYFRIQERSIASRMGAREADKLQGTAPDGLPIPPAGLIVLVGGETSVDAFLHGGRVAAKTIRQTLERHGARMESLRAILELGCGCGRVIRHWRSLSGVEIHGTDYNEELVQWCQAYLPFARFETNRLSPPLRYRDEAFDLVYAISVFTHLDERLGVAWMRELGRVLEPGGHLLVTTHGQSFRERLVGLDRDRFDAGALVVGHEEAPGTNLCNAYHPDAYVRGTLARDWQIMEHVDASVLVQDVYLLRKPVR